MQKSKKWPEYTGLYCIIFINNKFSFEKYGQNKQLKVNKEGKFLIECLTDSQTVSKMLEFAFF